MYFQYENMRRFESLKKNLDYEKKNPSPHVGCDPPEEAYF